jgi:hypothetical protein
LRTRAWHQTFLIPTPACSRHLSRCAWTSGGELREEGTLAKSSDIGMGLRRMAGATHAGGCSFTRNRSLSSRQDPEATSRHRPPDLPRNSCRDASLAWTHATRAYFRLWYDCVRRDPQRWKAPKSASASSVKGLRTFWNRPRPWRLLAMVRR